MVPTVRVSKSLIEPILQYGVLISRLANVTDLKNSYAKVTLFFIENWYFANLKK